MKNTLLIGLLVITLVVGNLAQAQDGDRFTPDQRAAFDLVQAAVDQLYASGSYAVSGQNEQSQRTNMIDESLDLNTQARTTFTTRLVVMPDGQLVAAQGTLAHTSRTWRGGEEGTYSSGGVSSFILMDDQLYQRFVMMLPLYMQPDGSFLNRWYTITADDLLAIYAFEYGSTPITLQALMIPVITALPDETWRLSGLLIPLDETLVLDAVELPGDTIDGQPVRGFELTLDPFPMMVEQLKVQPFVTTDLSAGLDADTYDALVVFMREKQHLRYRYWIGTDDHRLYRFETLTDGDYNTVDMQLAVPSLADADFAPDRMTFASEGRFTLDFSAFGETFAIEAPPDADSFIAWFE